MLINYYAWDNEVICGTQLKNIKNSNSRILLDYKPYNNNLLAKVSSSSVPLLLSWALYALCAIRSATTNPPCEIA